MKLFARLRISETTVPAIEWDMTPDLAFCLFSAKGLRDSLSTGDERLCYFFIDSYGETPRLFLMERGTRYVNVLAEILAPVAMLSSCISKQGGSDSSKDNFPIDSTIKEWLISEVMEAEDSPLVIPAIDESSIAEEWGDPLPLPLPGSKENASKPGITLPAGNSPLSSEQVSETVKKYNFYDKVLNPEGEFSNSLAREEAPDTIIDQRTGLMWQRDGLELGSIRHIRSAMEQLTKEGFAGYHDWRMPTLAEAMSLMEADENSKGLHLHPCFSKEYPFIFTANRRTPTGYWFVDYKQGKTYWSSGTVPGGFCRMCRTWVMDR